MSVVCEVVATRLGWPEGPTRLPDGRLVFVETYRSQLTVFDGVETKQFADVGGGPNAALAGNDGTIYVTQNGGVIGPWRAEKQQPPSIQVVESDGRIEVLATSVAGNELKAPNDLVFGSDGCLYFTDPGGPFDPIGRTNVGRIFKLCPGGKGEVVWETGPTYPNGIVIEDDGSVVWVESYTRALIRIKNNAPEVVCILPENVVPDGMKLAANGDFYITGVDSGTVEVVSRSGELKEPLRIGGAPTNCVFVGETLFLTDGGIPGTSTKANYTGRLWRAVLPGVVGQTVALGHVAVAESNPAR